MKNVPSTGWNRSALPPAAGNKSPLIQALLEYDRLGRRRFHVPAHAGFPLGDGDAIWGEPYRYDLTELDGLDVLSEPAGCLRESQEQAAAGYGVAHTFYLVNGASVGLAAAVLAAVKPGDIVLMPRNAHRSVLSGLILSGAQPVWFLPERLSDWGLWGPVRPETVAALLAKHPGARALCLTSPTYEGLGSDIEAIAALCREQDVRLIVDEAHGGLWPFSQRLPISACQSGADVVVHSLHKSAGSLTQTALAHLPQGSRLEASLFQQALNTLHTTSPSYPLLANIEATVQHLAEPDFRARLEGHLDQVQALRADLQRALTVFELFEPADRRFWDPTRLYLVNRRESGEDWGARIEAEGRIAYESASPYGVLYLANIGLNEDDFQAFQSVFQAADRQAVASAGDLAEVWQQGDSAALPDMALPPREAFFAPGERVMPSRAAGRIAKQPVVHCPPGIPILMPGERIQPAHAPLLPEEGVLVVR